MTTLSDLNEERDRLIEKAFEGEHGCFTGDCPHLKTDECYRAIATVFFNACLALVEEKRVKPLREALKRYADGKDFLVIKPEKKHLYANDSEWRKRSMSDISIEGLAQEALAQVPELEVGE